MQIFQVWGKIWELTLNISFEIEVHGTLFIVWVPIIRIVKKMHPSGWLVANFCHHQQLHFNSFALYNFMLRTKFSSKLWFFQLSNKDHFWGTEHQKGKSGEVSYFCFVQLGNFKKRLVSNIKHSAESFWQPGFISKSPEISKAFEFILQE